MMEEENFTLFEEAGIQLQNGKATEQMMKSIYKLAKLLVCPLCDKVRNFLVKVMKFFIVLNNSNRIIVAISIPLLFCQNRSLINQRR
jgi:hypothetical protein